MPLFGNDGGTFMKKLLVVLMTVLITLSLAGCGKNSPKATAEELFEAIKNTDQKVLDKIYLGEADENSIISDLIEIIEETESLGSIGELFRKSFLDFKYKVKDVEEDGDTAIAKVEVTTENWAKVLPNVTVLISAKALSMALDGKSEKEMGKAFKEIYEEQRKETDDVTFNLDIKLVKDEGEWKVDLSNEAGAILNAVTGGLGYWY